MAIPEAAENGSTTAPDSDPQTIPSEDPATTTTAEPSSTTTETPAAAPTEPDPSAHNTESESAPASELHAPATPAEKKWPGWPGDCVFRLIVPVLKVGSIIGRRGDLIKKMCEETRARIRVLDGAVGTPDRVVLISGKEEPETPLSPAMDAVIRIFKRISGLSESEGDSKASGAAAVAFSSIRLLVASTQAINLIGKQGSLIKSIQESTGASVRVLSGDEVPLYVAADERIVELQGDTPKVLKALEAVVGHLRRFLVDHSVLPLFEKSYAAPVSQDRIVDTWPEKSSLHTASQTAVATDYPLSVSTNRDSLFLDRETHLESHLLPSGISLYGQDPGISGMRSSGLGRTGAPIVTQITQTMQIPLSYADAILGPKGSNIALIRRSSGATLSVQESRGLPDEITVEIKGTSSQVQTAQHMIQEAMNTHNEPVTSSYGGMDTGLRYSYSQLGSTSYPSSAFSSQSYGGYGSSSLGGYSSFRL
ncbi:RNA-binding KH domain-containing protein PEPPER [Alnus glutinosa]|uniref:RNA-binding KH domain-containing protein PEPPER n=1 Tax=Alnus glutinosa TaxID=3517 RepID=UPI002D76EE53|nr:RNA-binding KH domain-containing protein PEPPER [Alnus glutinosa]